MPPARPWPPGTRYEVSLGYQYLHLPDTNFPAGVNLDGARNFGPWAVAAAVGWSRKAEDDDILGADSTANASECATCDR